MIVDDHPAVRMTLRLLLASEGYDVVAETGNGAQVPALIELHDPSIMVLDLAMPGVDGLMLMGQLAARKCPVKIIVFTGLDAQDLTARCRQLGACGFVSKNSELSELVYALRAVRASDDYFTHLPDTQASDWAAREQALMARLSARECSVMKYLLQGLRNSEIADCMALNRRTISTYKIRMFNKLNIRGISDLYAMAKRNGIV